MGTPNLRGSSWSCHSLNLFAQLHFSCGFLESPLRLPGTVHRGATVASLSISLSDPLNPGLHGRGSPKPRPWHRALSRLPAAWSSIPLCHVWPCSPAARKEGPPCLACPALGGVRGPVPAPPSWVTVILHPDLGRLGQRGQEPVCLLRVWVGRDLRLFFLWLIL